MLAVVAAVLVAEQRVAVALSLHARVVVVVAAVATSFAPAAAPRVSS